MIVHELREQAVPYRAIRSTINDLRKRFGRRGWQQLHLDERHLNQIVGLLNDYGPKWPPKPEERTRPTGQSR
jgi:hypothetical protein